MRIQLTLEMCYVRVQYVNFKKQKVNLLCVFKIQIVWFTEDDSMIYSVIKKQYSEVQINKTKVKILIDKIKHKISQLNQDWNFIFFNLN